MEIMLSFSFTVVEVDNLEHIYFPKLFNYFSNRLYWYLDIDLWNILHYFLIVQVDYFGAN